MTRLAPVKARVIIALLTQLGFRLLRQEGSHQQFEHPDGRRVTVPIHGSGEVDTCVLRNILKQISWSRADWEKFR